MAKIRAVLEAEAKALFLPDKEIQSAVTKADLQQYINDNKPAEGCRIILATQEMIDENPEEFDGIAVGDRIEIEEVEEGEVTAPPVDEDREAEKAKAKEENEAVKAQEKQNKEEAIEQEAKDEQAISDHKDEQEGIARYTPDYCTKEGKIIEGKAIILPLKHTLIHGGPILNGIKHPYGFSVLRAPDGTDCVEGTGKKFGVGNGVKLVGNQNTPDGELNNYQIVY